MEERIAPSLTSCLLPRYARILKPGTSGSPVAPPSSGCCDEKRIAPSLTSCLLPRFAWILKNPVLGPVLPPFNWGYAEGVASCESTAPLDSPSVG